jgi:hypothetical protein
MINPLPRLTAPESTGHAPAFAIAALADALRSEYRLLDELVAVLQRQRCAVADEDLQTVEESVYSTHRVLNTLSEARRRRRSLNRLLGESDDLSTRGLEHALGARMTDELRAARDQLEAMAHVLSREVEVNRRVLREALNSGRLAPDVAALVDGGQP